MKPNSTLLGIILLFMLASCEKNTENEKIKVFNDWTQGPDLKTGVFGGSLIAHNNYLYLIGGVVDFTINYTTDIQRAAINTDGSLENWEIMGSLPSVSADHYSFVRDNNIYIINTLSGDIFAPINEDGTFGTWEYLASGNRPSASAMAVYNDFLYRIGGWMVIDNDYHESIQTVYKSELTSTSSIEPWETSVALGVARDYIGCIANNGYLYVFGGHSQGQNYYEFQDMVESIKINDDGSLDTWISQGTLPIDAHSITPLVYQNSVYLLSRDLPNIIYTELQEEGKIGDWKTSNTEFPLGVHHSACIYKNHLYIMGGIINGDDNGTGSKKVYYTSFLD